MRCDGRCSPGVEWVWDHVWVRRVWKRRGVPREIGDFESKDVYGNVGGVEYFNPAGSPAVELIDEEFRDRANRWEAPCRIADYERQGSRVLSVRVRNECPDFEIVNCPGGDLQVRVVIVV